MNDPTTDRLPSSFRDPSGFVFRRGGELFRQVNQVYRDDFDLLVGSGLYDELAEAGLLVRHRETDAPAEVPGLAYKVIAPEPLPFISYPYEWSFGQLKDAALLTLDLQRRALDRGMSLKDASAYNVQFRGARPVFMDTLSFEKAKDRPWVAYRQFTQHFLAPLALMSKVHVGLNSLLVTNLDGIPLDLAAALLPHRTLLSPGLLIHLHLHAKTAGRYAETDQADPDKAKTQVRPISVASQRAFVESLESAVNGLTWEPKGTEWAEYYSNVGYADPALAAKTKFVGRFLDARKPKTVWDIGANTGAFSRLASSRGASTVAFDIDPACVERNYREAKRADESNLLPLRLDFLNPSPAIGWANRERMSLFERGPADAVLVLAAVHHLAVTGNVPLPQIAEALSRLARSLVVEFVPKSDPQFRRIMGVREDVFADYSQESFEAAFRPYFTTELAEPLPSSERTLYEMTATASLSDFHGGQADRR